MAKRSNFQDQMLADALPVLDALIMEEYDRYPDYIGAIFRIYSSKTWGEQTTTVAGVKAAVEKQEGEAVTFDDPIEGFDKTYTHTTYAIATSFSEELIEDDRLNLVEDTYRSLGLATYQTRQVQAFGVLNDGFTDTGPDGQNLFDTGHTMIDGGSVANRPSSDIALSVAGMRQMEIDLMKQVNHRNINIHVMPETVIVPPDISQVAKELISSPDRPDTPNRAMNTLYSQNYKLIVSPFLTSTSAWVAIANKTQHQLRFYDRVNPTSKTWEDEKTGDVNTKIRTRFSVGYSDFIGTWGTSP